MIIPYIMENKTCSKPPTSRIYGVWEQKLWELDIYWSFSMYNCRACWYDHCWASYKKGCMATYPISRGRIFPIWKRRLLEKLFPVASKCRDVKAMDNGYRQNHRDPYVVLIKSETMAKKTPTKINQSWTNHFRARWITLPVAGCCHCHNYPAAAPVATEPSYHGDSGHISKANFAGFRVEAWRVCQSNGSDEARVRSKCAFGVVHTSGF